MRLGRNMRPREPQTGKVLAGWLLPGQDASEQSQEGGCTQVWGIWLSHAPDVVSLTPLYPAHVSITSGENVTEKKTNDPEVSWTNVART